ncbi:carbohydrate ABC transporter permease [Streptomyces sp. CA-111067]|uniref:carbohydrate ABC transporter permease n=1 Tax=Streptomyces sp. CA-111067 TaxID=3240046 RepID=UPI003D95511F
MSVPWKAGATPGARTGSGTGHRLGRPLLYLVLIALAVIAVLPLLWALSGSFKTISEIFEIPPRIWPRHATGSNYATVFSDIALPSWLWTSLWVAVVSTVLSVLFSTMGGYAFAKFDFPGKKILFDVMFSSMMIPMTVVVIPLFVEIAALGMGNSYLALIVPGLAPAFGVFMMRQFIVQSIPDQMLEVARVDGAGEIAIFLRIVLPLLRPALGALIVWNFLASYNNFLWPLIVLSDSGKFTLPLGLNSLSGAYTADYGVILAGSLIASVPTIAVFVGLNKQLIEGLTVGALKG